MPHNLGEINLPPQNPIRKKNPWIAMRENLFFSLRFRLVGLVLLTVLPALVLLFYFSWEQRRHALEEARQKARTLALVTSEQFNKVITDQGNTLYILSMLPQAKGRDLASLNLIFAGLLKKPAGVLGYRLADAQGRLLGGVPQPAMPTSYADRAWFRRLQETRRFQVSDFVIGKTIPQPIMPLAYPVLDSRGEIDGILVASFSVGWLDDFLKKCQLPPGTHALLVDRQGAVLANYPHAGEKVGQSLPQSPLIRAMLDRQEGFVEAGCLAGDIPVIYAFTAVGEGEEPLKLAVGFEKAMVLHHVGRDFLFHLSLLGLAVGLALAGSLAFGHLLVRRPVLGILEATRRVAAGDLEARTGLPAGKGELNRLGQGFDEMTAALKQRDAERREAEEALHRSEQKYRLLVSQIPAMVFQGYGDWSIDPLDEKIEVLTGYSKEDFDSRRVKWCDLIPAEDLDYAAEVFIEALKTDKSYVREHRLRKKDGEIIWVQCRGQIFLNDQGKVDHISGVSFDVTQRRLAEEAVREGERFLADVFASIQDGINILDTDYNIIRVNPTLERWYDHARPLVGKKCYEVIHGRQEPCENCPYRQTMETGKAAYKVTPREGKDGAEVGWLEVFVFPIMDLATGQVKGVIQHIRDITERQRAEETLQDRERFLTSIFASIQDGISVLDNEYNIVRVNPAMERAYAQAMPLVGKKCYEAYHGRREPCDICPAKTTLETGVAAREMVIEKGAGGENVRYVDLYTFPLLDMSSGQMTGVVEYVRDITVRQQAVESLQESEQKFRLLVKMVPAIVYIGYADWTVDFFDEKVEKLTGYAVEDFNSRRIKWSEIILAEDLERATEIFKQALRTNRSYVREYRIKERSGTIHWIRERGQVICDENGRIDYVTGVFSNITKEHEMEVALERLRLQNEMILNSAGEGIVGFDLMGKVTFVNPAVVSLTGYEPKELLGQSFHLLVHHQKPDGAPYPEEECPIYHTIRDGKRRHVTDDLFWTKEGKPLPVDYVTTSIEEGGQLVGAVGVFMDITERKQAEEALRRSEEQLRQAVKMEAVGRLAGGVAHDFNNILTAITGYGELLLMNLDPQDSGRQDVQDILLAADRAASLTRQLLAFSRKQVLQPQRLALNRVVANMDKMLRRIIGEDIDLVTVLGPEPGTVTADPGQIEQVIMNLAVNARDAMPQGGKLTIETADVDLDEAYAQNHLEAQPGPYVMLAVSDTGVGLDQEAQARIFEPFFTTKELGKGTGLGLSTVYGIIKQSGGLIWVYSEPGRGTTFKIYLPRLEAPGDVAGLSQVPGKCEWGSEIILLVEDEDMVRQVARRILARLGYTVLEAASGPDALVVSREHAGPLHLMLTDVVMPGMSGQEIMENLKPQRPEMKVLFMSGHTENAIVHHGVLDPGTAFIQKPFKHDFLAHKVREVLDKPAAG